MTKMQKMFNWILGGIRIVIAGFFATVFVIVLLPTITSLAAVLSYGLTMIFFGDFYLLIGLLTTLISIAILISKIVIPELKSGE